MQGELGEESLLGGFLDVSMMPSFKAMALRHENLWHRNEHVADGYSDLSC